MQFRLVAGLIGLTTLILVGCVRPYQPAPELVSGQHAELEIRSGSDATVPWGFVVQLYDYGDACPNAFSGGAKDSAYLGDLEVENEHDSILVPIPADTNVFILWSAGGPRGYHAAMHGFRPVAGRKYIVQLSTDGGAGRWRFVDASTGSPVRIMDLGDCD